jgi:hypothetical protein
MAKKLNAEIRRGSGHDIVAVNGTVFWLRRLGSGEIAMAAIHTFQGSSS